MNLNDLLDLTVRTKPGKAALEYEDDKGVVQTVSFGELYLRSLRMAAVLHRRKLAAGDRLCVFLKNSVDMLDLYLACVRLGVIFVPINILYKEREVTHILHDSQPAAVVVDGSLPTHTDNILQVSELAREALAEPAEAPRAALSGDDPAAIIYTSGTTGVSKGAILTHNNFAANAINLNSCWKIDCDDRLLLTLPLFHVHGLANGVHCWLLSGCRMRLLEKFDYRSAEEVFSDFQPTVFFGVPTMFVRLLGMPESSARTIGSFVRLFVSGSAPLPPQVLQDFHSHFGHTIVERYGMTETLMNTSNPYAGECRPGSVGLPLPGVSIQIRDRAGSVLPAGELGELYVRGPNVFPGYWRDEAATTDAFDGSYFRTGDIGSMSNDGYITLQGRRSDLIISGGFNIYPREIEEFLMEQDGVSEAAVTGMPDRLRGEVPVAYVVCDGAIPLEALEGLCRKAFASFKVPRTFVKVESLPRTALGKIRKHLLPPVEVRG